MKFKEILDLYNKQIPLIVRFTKEVEDLKIQFEENMMAKIVEIIDMKDGIYSICFDESEFKNHNLRLETPDCMGDNGKYTYKWSEVRKRNDIVSFYISDCEYDKKPYRFEIIPDVYQELIDEYLSLKSKLKYIDWLEQTISKLKMKEISFDEKEKPLNIGKFKEIFKEKLSSGPVIVIFKKGIENYTNSYKEGMIAELLTVDPVLEILEDDYGFNNFELIFDDYFYINYNNQIKFNTKNKTYNSIIFNQDDICMFEIISNDKLELIDEYLSYELDISFTDWLSEEILSLRMLND